MVIGFIIGCEIAFWVVLAAGLLLRYPLRRPRAGAVVLAAVPLVDLVLLVACALDLRAGATAGTRHALAALYLGFSLAFGHSMVRWADVRFAHRFAGGPKPQKPTNKRAHEWRLFGLAAIAWALTCAFLGAGIWWIGDPARTGALKAGLSQVSVVLAIWFVTGPLLTSNKSGRKQSTSKTKRR
ncbi:hypothetical protein ACFO1B_47695 [Dactylosporangium siamense]|uniref:Uncharacterized protein n=1 Tax=Dactylosporangium siamense TaxID=685454 RepID=A0A919PZG3_9ACTN|nr:hypothetical protein [Dactylosporangium siamense]GIG51533.1 hypothetical protein Dsi01nite_095740 [Dactylosporangium siamense]